MFAFQPKINIFVGLGFPHEVDCADEAIEFLNSWAGHRGARFYEALNVCRAVRAGDADAALARQAFEAFARQAGIIAPPDALDASNSGFGKAA